LRACDELAAGGDHDGADTWRRIDIWRAATLMLKRYGEKALEQSATRAERSRVSHGRKCRLAVDERLTPIIAFVANLRVKVAAWQRY
jgi:hypothetical protein